MPLLVIVIISIALAGGIASQYFFGKNNAVEEVAESIIERELNLPGGSIELPEILSHKD